MAAQPKLFNLVWKTFSFVVREDPSKGEFAVAPEHLNTIDTRPNIPAVILFPALLTPNLHVRSENHGMIELLVAAPKSPALLAKHVNQHLKVVSGLDPKKPVSSKPLFSKPGNKIVVKKAVHLSGHVETHGVFKGILHKTVANWLPKGLDAIYAVQIHESCLQPNPDGQEGEKDNEGPGVELQDFVIANVLARLNGPALQGQDGRGTHEFGIGSSGVDYSTVDPEFPIVAYHPLYVYPEGELQQVALGHISDFHLNARQKLLAKSPARVIDAESGTSESPAIGSLINNFEASFSEIIDQLGNSADVLLVGGDLIEHIDNAYPFHDGFGLRNLQSASAADIWNLVDLGDNTTATTKPTSISLPSSAASGISARRARNPPLW